MKYRRRKTNYWRVAEAFLLTVLVAVSGYSQRTNPEPVASPAPPASDPATIRNSGQIPNEAANSATAATAERPAYKSLRYDEDYSFLADETKRTDYLDRIKYISLGKEDWYVSIGGEIRPFYERFRNENFGAEPQGGNGFWLQRYMLHADWRLGKRVRVFSQLKSGVASGRRGGARPPDEDLLDVHQLFVDYNFSTLKNKSLTLRVGRQELSFGSSRLVTTREGPNVRISFDGVRLLSNLGKWSLNAFAVKPVETDAGFFDDEPVRTTTFGGFYAVRPLAILSKGGNIDLYYLGLDRKRARFN